jgi:signal transduction histidine kinase/CheY-like chemotaxis protein
MLKKKIFLRTTALVLILVGSITALLVVLAVRGQRAGTLQSYQTVANAMAGDIERLILWDDRVAVQLVLKRETNIHRLIEYAFVVKDGKIYADTLKGDVPTGLLRSAPASGDLPLVWEFQDKDGEAYYDIVAPIGRLNAQLRLGIKRHSIDQQIHRAVVVISGVGCAAFLIGLVFAYLIAVGATREVRLLSRAVCSFVENGDPERFKADDEGTSVAELVRSVRVLMSERKRAEAERERAREFLQTVIDGFPESLMVINRDHTVALANRAALELSGWKQIGSTCYRFSHNSDRPCADAEHFCPMEQVVASKAPVTVKHIHQSVEGNLLSVNIIAAPILDEDGEVVQVIESSRDITDWEKLQAQLNQAQKLESIGRLAGGVAHDFNNILGVILGHAEMSMVQLDPLHPIYSELQEITKAARRSAELTRQLLAFARKQTVATRILDLNDTIEGMLKMLQRLIGENIELIWLPGKEVWPIRMDPSQIDQILANLCVNARDAIMDVGTITIETGAVTMGGNCYNDHPEAVPGDYVTLAVSDNGCGMDVETIGKIFEPFFTTKDVGQGTGLGLATIYGIVKQNQGFIQVDSQPGQGTCFKLYLPRHMAEVPPPPGEGRNTPIGKVQEVVLLVEDNQLFLNVIKRMLDLRGYHVLTASAPGEAIRLVEGYGDRIHLLITDVVMPEMNGKALAERLQAHQPDLRCLYMSGYTADAIARRGILNEDIRFIQKPFSLNDLALKIREALA